jgi:branched-chain amino acid transport system permease protein
VDLTNAVVQGILIGGLYAIFATGLSLVFGVMRIVNLAHGDFATVAAFLALVLVTNVGLPVWATFVVVVPVMALLGYVVQRGLLQRTLSASPLPVLLVTFALSIVVSNLLLEVFSSDQRRLQLGALDTASFRVGALAIGVFPLLVFALAVLILGSLSAFLARTRTGRALRATSDDQEAAQLSGVDNRHVFGVATALAFGTVAVAGILSGAQTSFTPTSGATLLIFAFEVVIIGGLGNLWGSLAGGVVLGVAQNVGAWIDPAQQILAGHLVFLLVLALRPQGLFGRAVPA